MSVGKILQDKEVVPGSWVMVVTTNPDGTTTNLKITDANRVQFVIPETRPLGFPLPPMELRKKRKVKQ